MNEELETMNEEVSQDIEQQADAEVAEQAPQSMLDAVTQALNEDASDAEPEVEAQGEADTVANRAAIRTTAARLGGATGRGNAGVRLLGRWRRQARSNAPGLFDGARPPTAGTDGAFPRSVREAQP